MHENTTIRQDYSAKLGVIAKGSQRILREPQRIISYHNTMHINNIY